MIEGGRIRPLNMEIRFLNAEDAKAYWDIRLEALETEPQAFGASAEDHRKLTLEDASSRLFSDAPNNFAIGALLGERLVGTAGFVRDKGIKERHKGFIWGVYLKPEARGQGIARKMLGALLDRAAATEGVEQVRLSVATGQQPAMKLYRSLGFEPFGLERRAIKVGEQYIDEEHMVLFLNQWNSAGESPR